MGIKAEKYHDLFVKNDITDELLPYLTRSDLEEIGIPSSDLDDIFESIKCVNKNCKTTSCKVHSATSFAPLDAW